MGETAAANSETENTTRPISSIFLRPMASARRPMIGEQVVEATKNTRMISADEFIDTP
ncbi:hypothetical protein D9M68_789300 [compost metagenome]